MPDPDPKYKIGDKTFVRLDFPAGPDEQIAIESRFGVEGHDIWQGGELGAVQQLASFTDAENVTKARDYFKEYQDLKKEGPQAVTWDGVELAFMLKVLAVAPVPRGIRKIVLGVGGLHGVTPNTSGARCECMWTVLPIAKPPPPAP